jgi:DNA-binding response OmpR family regulator
MAGAPIENVSGAPVLVVEDETAIGELICEIVEGAGLPAERAASDRAAYAALESARPYSALVLDVNLGAGTTGFDVARFARRRRRRLPVLFVTGQAGADEVAAYGVPDARLVTKPFTSDELMAALNALTGRGTGR